MIDDKVILSTIADNLSATIPENGELAMLMRTPGDLGAAIRDHRRQQGLSQQGLAAKIGVSRQWVAEIEKGKGRAALGLMLRAFDALGLALSLAPEQFDRNSPGIGPPDLADSDTMIDRIIDNARGWP